MGSVLGAAGTRKVTRSELDPIVHKIIAVVFVSISVHSLQIHYQLRLLKGTWIGRVYRQMGLAQHAKLVGQKNCLCAVRFFDAITTHNQVIELPANY